MITSIVLENFKCFRKVEVNPRLITVFVGPNGNGKSSVLQALVLMKQSLDQSGLNIEGDFLKFNKVEDIFPKFQDVSDQYDIKFGGIQTKYDSPNSDFGNKVHYSYGANFFGSKLVSHSGGIRFNSGSNSHFIRATDSLIFPAELDMGKYRASLVAVRKIGNLIALGSWLDSIPEPPIVRAFEIIRSYAVELSR